MPVQPDKDGPRRHDEDAGDLSARGTTRRRTAIIFGVVVLMCAGLVVAVMALRPSDARSAMDSGHYSIAREFLQQAAQDGNARAQNTLGNLLYLGLGGSRDQRAAAAWYLESALQGNTDAQINMARHYILGLGISKDPMRAFAWLFHARSAGREVAEGDIKLLAGSAQITPTHLQRVRQLYPTIESLRPNPGGE